jgi:hypothetical protein
MLFKKQKFDWLMVALFGLGIFLYCSYQPRLRLRTVMPADFVDQESSMSAPTSSRETEIAGAYWNCLATSVQWKYGYGHTLPADPPSDFSVAQNSSTGAEDTATRTRYWRRAQHLWYLPTSWQREYEWSFDWTTTWVQNGGDALHHLFERLGN